MPRASPGRRDRRTPACCRPGRPDGRTRAHGPPAAGADRSSARFAARRRRVRVPPRRPGRRGPGIVPSQGDPAARDGREQFLQHAGDLAHRVTSPAHAGDERLAGENALDPSHAPVRPSVPPPATTARPRSPQPRRPPGSPAAGHDAPGGQAAQHGMRRSSPARSAPRAIWGSLAMSSPSQKNASYSACLNCRQFPLLGGPQAGGERKRRTGLVVRQVDLDPERLRPPT